jgi:hypothetical protein
MARLHTAKARNFKKRDGKSLHYVGIKMSKGIEKNMIICHKEGTTLNRSPEKQDASCLNLNSIK